jgi:glycosyltransferase involved in cell wall biosynthesis
MAHIVHIAKWYPPVVGGMERVIEFYADAARSGGHDVTVICCTKGDRPGRTTTSTGVAVERVQSWGIVKSMPISPGLPAVMRRVIPTADIVHFHEPYPFGTLYLLMLRRSRKLVTTWHSDIVKQKLLKPYAEWLQNKLADRTDRIVCTTGRMAASSPVLVGHVDRIRIVPFMIDTAPFDAVRTDQERIVATRWRWGGRFMLGCGRLVSYKGFEFLIDALAGTNMRAVIVGEGPLRTDLEAKARSLGVSEQVVFAGAVDDKTVRDLYCACEFFAFPSATPNEAFGIVQLEAMAAGRPVINTWLPTSVPAVSLDGETGLTVPPRDVAALREAMLQLWTDAPLREKYAAAAVARIRDHFERSRVTGQLLAFYDEVLEA